MNLFCRGVGFTHFGYSNNLFDQGILLYNTHQVVPKTRGKIITQFIITELITDDIVIPILCTRTSCIHYTAEELGVPNYRTHYG